MNIMMLSPHDLVPYANNSKLHPETQVAAIAKSIEAFGFDQPIVVDKNRVIIKGHGRRLAAISLGMELVPVVVRDDVTENEAKFLREVDNQIQSVEWDKENLATELNDLKDAGMLELTLFTEDQIPNLPMLEVSAAAGTFNLNTKHTCSKCDYKW